MAWRGSFSRSFISTARASASRSSRPPPPPLSSFRRVRPSSLQPRRLSFSNPRTLGELGCIQSLMPLHNVMAGARLTSHLAANARACCELYNVFRPFQAFNKKTVDLSFTYGNEKTTNLGYLKHFVGSTEWMLKDRILAKGISCKNS